MSRDSTFGRGISLLTLLLVLLGVWFCYLAFSLVRVIVFWLLFHMIGIAATATVVAVLFVAWNIKKG